MAELEERLRSYWTGVVLEHPLPDAADLMAEVDERGAGDYLTLVDEPPSPARHPGWIRSSSGRRRAVVVLAVAAAVAAVVALRSVGSDGNQQSVDLSPANRETAEVVAQSFMTAWVEGDGAAAAALFTNDGVFDELPAEELVGRHEWFTATGWRFVSRGCAVGPTTTCRYTFENALTDALGRGAIDSSFVLTVDGGRIANVVNDFNLDEYSDIWELFLGWIARDHPADVELMYVADWSLPRWDATAISLWTQHQGEFVAAVGPYVERTAAICRNARSRATAEGDAPRVLSDALVELRAAAIPEMVRTKAETGHRLIERYVEALQASTSPGSGARDEDLAKAEERLLALGYGFQECVVDVSE